MGGETRFAWRGSSKLPYGGPVPQGQTTFALRRQARRCAHPGSGACSPDRIEHRPPGVLRGSPHIMSMDLPVPAWSDLLFQVHQAREQDLLLSTVRVCRLRSLVMPSSRAVPVSACVDGVAGRAGRAGALEELLADAVSARALRAPPAGHDVRAGAERGQHRGLRPGRVLGPRRWLRHGAGDVVRSARRRGPAGHASAGWRRDLPGQEAARRADHAAARRARRRSSRR